MKKLFFAVVIGTVAFLGCRDEAAEPTIEPGVTPTTPDSTVMEKVDTVLTGETLTFFNQSGLTNYAKSRLEGFDWSKFRLVNVYRDDSMVTSSFTPDQRFLQNYGPFLKYSPDSSRIIDLDSYNIEITAQNGGQFTGHEKGPDNEVSLIDLDSNLRKRLVFLGPGGSVEDGTWLDNETLVLVGVHENATATGKTPVVWKYHVPTNTFFLYEMPEATSAEKLMGDWRKERLKNVRLE